MFLEKHWFWLGVGALIGFVFLFNFLFTLALSYLNRKGPFLCIDASSYLSLRL